MNGPQKDVVIWIGLGVVGIMLLPKLASMFTRNVGQAAGGAITDAVIGTGEGLGLPQTDAKKCAAAVAAGNIGAASVYCPAGTFVATLPVSIGANIGAPPTNKAQCAIDMANGDTWAASVSCDAATYLKYLAANLP